MTERNSSGRLSTHVLDAARGRPAAGLRLSLWRIEEGGGRVPLGEFVTNEDGRTAAPLLAGAALRPGRYEILFLAGDWLRQAGLLGGPGASGEEGAGDPLFLDEIPIRFGIREAGQHLHVPLLLSPYAYSTYRGS